MPRSLIWATALLFGAVLSLGFYLAHLKRAAEQRPALVDRPVTAPVSTAAERITLYVADDTQAALMRNEITAELPKGDQSRGREIVRTLLSQYLKPDSPHPLGAGADITDLFLVGGTTAVVNVNAAFAEGHRSGVLVEELTVASIAQTLAANMPKVTKVKIVVDGKERETLAGHADLIALYDVSNGRELVRENSPAPTPANGKGVQ
jgi:Sporulation and spore germination